MAKQYSETGRVLRFEPEDGPRRLKYIVRGKPIWYPTPQAATKAWSDLCMKIMQCSVDDARATIDVELGHDEDKGYIIQGTIHPARLMYRMALEERGVLIRVGEAGEHWHRLSQKPHKELFEEMTKPNRGRYW